MMGDVSFPKKEISRQREFRGSAFLFAFAFGSDAS